MKRLIVSATVVLALSGVAHGAIQLESELDGTTSNNTLGSAEAIPGANFTLPVPATVFNPPGWATATIVGTGATAAGAESDVDFYSFTSPGGKAIFDIDNDTLTFDTMLSLFDSGGTLIGWNDDSFSDPGSPDRFDSFLGEINLSSGQYFIAVSGFPNFPSALTGGSPLVRPDGGDGGIAIAGATPGDSSFPESGPDGPSAYTLHISLENVDGGTGGVPEPMSLTVWVMLGTITLAATRRQKLSH
jgi:hypothetical protein